MEGWPAGKENYIFEKVIENHKPLVKTFWCLDEALCLENTLRLDNSESSGRSMNRSMEYLLHGLQKSFQLKHFVLFCVVLGTELWALGTPGKCSITELHTPLSQIYLN